MQVNVTDIIDQSRIHPLLMPVLALCGLCMVMDGFDVQSMSYVAPAIISEWHIAKPSLGPVFSAGLFGIMVGSLALSIVADKVGRRPVLIGAMIFLAASMFATTQATTLNSLLALRLITGIAMGAIIPNAIALAGEFSPLRFRVTLMMIVSSGFIIGGALGGFVAAALIPVFGWQSVFYAGAIAPLIVGAMLVLALPESPQFLVARGKDLDEARTLLMRIAPDAGLGVETEFVLPKKAPKGPPVLDLFHNGLATGTALLWVVNFMNLLCAFFLANWLPVVVAGAGHSASEAVLAGTMLWVGGLIGNFLLGWLIDRYGFGPVLSSTFVVAAIAIAAVGQVVGSVVVVFVTIGVAGFCVLGAQSGLNALGPTYYPVSMRSTGTGWASGIGRLGSILGPLIGGQLMQHDWTTAELFRCAAAPAVVAVLAMLAFWRLVKLPRRENWSFRNRELEA